MFSMIDKDFISKYICIFILNIYTLILVFSFTLSQNCTEINFQTFNVFFLTSDC